MAMLELVTVSLRLARFASIYFAADIAEWPASQPRGLHGDGSQGHNL